MSRVLYPTPTATPPPRVAPLARLPVFLNLTGQRVIVIGGDDAAAWKAELLAAAGARVEIFAPVPTEAATVLLAREDLALTHHPRPWEPADIAGAALVVASVTDTGEAAAVHAAARATGVPVNVIDRPAFCDFQFGAIVNRSPVVIGISTDGAAPVLGQAIRRRIETLLPSGLAGWAEVARNLRGRVVERLPLLAQRRAFWARFAEQAFVAPPPSRTEEVELSVQPAAGHVVLVGAGPGEAELLTLKAVRALQSADVILFDDLVSDEVLELARREARRMLVGKRGGRDSCRQEEINALMIKLARQGKRVVRLKSGDPMIFGRAGEEIAELRAAGIAVDVVPGITAALAMAAALGVSLTHRAHAQSLRLITGHGRDGDVPSGLDWKGLADAASTLVFYMAGRTAPEIARRLVEHGLSGTTPVILVQSLTRPEERRWHGTLEELPLAAASGGSGPILIGIGSVFGMSARGGMDHAIRAPGSALALA